MAGVTERRIDISRLPPRELASLRDTLTEEVRGLAQRSLALQKVAAQFGGSGRAIERLGEQEAGAWRGGGGVGGGEAGRRRRIAASPHPFIAGQPVLVPLTSSMHVPGTLKDPNRVLIDVGTGYYVQMTAARGADYCKRKIEYVRERLDDIGQVIASRQAAVAQIGSLLARQR